MVHPLLDGTLRLGVGIEDTFIPNASVGRRALDEYELTQHYRDWAIDLDLVRQSGAGLLRYGFPWYRLNPEAGRYCWDWADRVVDHLASLDAQVVVDLVHYGTPLWLDNQFLNRGYPAVVAEYAYAFAERYGDRLTAYTPLNEPQWTARLCGESGTWPPELTGHDGYLQLMLAISRGIVTTQEAVQAAIPDAAFVHVEASFRYDVEAGADRSEADLLGLRRFLALDLVTGRVQDGHGLARYLQLHGVTDQELMWFADHQAHPDVLGLNYYPMWSTMTYQRRAGQTVASERNDDVDGLLDVLRIGADRYGVPVMLTETSFEGSVAERLDWFERSFAAVEQLSTELPVAGYVWWPFFDQIKWQYREGNGTPVEHLHQLGLVDLDADDVGVFRRHHNEAFTRFRERAHARAPRPAAEREAIA